MLVPVNEVESRPSDLVLVGRVGEAYGLKGGVHVIPYSPDAAALLAAREWWLEGPGAVPLRSVDVFSAKAHGSGVVAQLVGIVDRDVAVKLKGASVLVSRSRFPVLNDDEYYWADLIGLEVVNEAGELLGRVAGLTETGAHAVLEVDGQAVAGGAAVAQGVADATGTAGMAPTVQRLIPFVDAIVKTVDRGAGRIVVDWGLDY